MLVHDVPIRIDKHQCRSGTDFQLFGNFDTLHEIERQVDSGIVSFIIKIIGILMPFLKRNVRVWIGTHHQDSRVFK